MTETSILIVVFGTLFICLLSSFAIAVLAGRAATKA